MSNATARNICYRCNKVFAVIRSSQHSLHANHITRAERFESDANSPLKQLSTSQCSLASRGPLVRGSIG